MPSPTSLSSVRADAIARRDRGDLHSARTLLERALEAATMTSGEDHPEVLTTSHLLAKLHRQAGDLSGARRVLENALYAGSHRHGDEHPMLLSISFDLAEISDELGNRHEARKHYTRIARLGPGAPGYDQQQVQAARAWLGPSAPPVAPVQGRPVTLPAPEPIIAPPPPPPVVEEAPKTEWPPLTPVEEEKPPTLPRRVPGGTDFAKPIPPHLTDDDTKETTDAKAAAIYSPTEEVPQIRREATPPPNAHHCSPETAAFSPGTTKISTAPAAS